MINHLSQLLSKTNINYMSLFQFVPSTSCTPLISFIRNYKMKDSLKKRCESCRLERREGRLYIECEAKPRHKQAQRMFNPNPRLDFKRKIWKEVRWY